MTTTQQRRAGLMLCFVLLFTVIGSTRANSTIAGHSIPPFNTTSGTLTEGWPARYNGPGNGIDVPFDVTVDTSWNVYVTGTSFGSSGTYNYATVKYDSNGNQLWIARYDGPGTGNDTALQVTVDRFDSVYVTGKSSGIDTGEDLTTVKYDSNGNQIWVQRYNGPGNGDDSGSSIVVDNEGHVYVTGSTLGAGTDYDATTIKYDTNGDQMWVQRFNDPGTWQYMNDFARQLLLDNSGNLYVIGTSDGFSTIQDYLILKYDSNGTLLRVQTYNGPGDWMDRIQQAVLDSTGNLYVVGLSHGSGSDWDYATVKYAPDGTQLWVRRYNGPYNGVDAATSIAVDNNANVYITGISQGVQGVSNYTTIKYTANGTQVWAQRYNEPACQWSDILQLALDSAGNVYVAGCVAHPTTHEDLIVLKYISDGTLIKTQRYNDPIDGSDSLERNSSAIFIDGADNIYVIGQSDGNGTSKDYLTLKYQPTDFDVPTPTPTATPLVTPTATPTATPTPSPTAIGSLPPVAESLSINGNALTTPSITVSLRVSASDPDGNPQAMSMSFSNDGVGWSDWQPYASFAQWQLASGDGVKTVYGRFKNSADLLSAVVSDTITLDSSVEQEYGLTINNGALYTSKVLVSLKISAKPGTAEMQVSNDGGFDGVSWQPYTSHKSWELTRYRHEEITRLVYIRFRDAQGNVSATYLDDIILDMNPPDGDVHVTSTDAGATLLLSATDDVSGVDSMRLSAEPDFTGIDWEAFASSRAWSFGYDSTVYVQFRDNAGNISQTYSATYTEQSRIFLPFVQR
jgi:Beta-propeller repeat